MKHDSIDPPNEPQPNEARDGEFMAKFQKVIESYAAAVNADQDEEANQAALEVLMMAGAEAMAHPTPDLLLQEEADRFLRAGDWARAEDAYRRLLAVQEQSGNFGLVAKPQMDLCQFFRLIGRLDEAWAFAWAATESARRAEVFPLMAMALENEALCALARGDTARGLQAASEAVQVIEPGKMADLLRAQAYTIRAQCLKAAGDTDAAEEDLQRSWEILGKKKTSGIATGPVATLAKWFEVRGELDLQKGALADARSALQRAIEYRREGLARACDPSPHAFAALARSLGRLAKVMEQAGESASAQKARAEAQELWNKLHLPDQLTD